jgi:hypothetical protein
VTLILLLVFTLPAETQKQFNLEIRNTANKMQIINIDSIVEIAKTQ